MIFKIARVFSRLTEHHLRALLSNSDWFIMLFTSAVIGQNYCFGFVSYETQSKTTLKTI